jgi:predicted amino acid dehydrogenase
MSAERSFALIGHPTSVEGIRAYLSFVQSGGADTRVGDEALRKLFDWTPAYKALDLKFTSRATHTSVSGSLLIATFLPEMLLKERKRVVGKVEEAIQLADRRGATVGALGGFTSIADNASGALVARSATSTRMTNGTAATSIMTIEGVEVLCRETGLDLGDAVVAIVGATGSIGRTCAAHFRSAVRTLVLTGKNQRKLSAFFGDWAGPSSNVILMTDNAQAISQADVVVFVTSATKPICGEEAFKPGALVCDVGFPKNVVSANQERDDIILYAGGLARPPSELRLRAVLGLPGDDMIYGCFAEAIAIAMEGCIECCAASPDDIMPVTLKIIKAALFKHGFALPPFMNTRKTYTADDFARVRALRRPASRQKWTLENDHRRAATVMTLASGE